LFTLGLGLEDLWWNGAALLGTGVVFIAIAALFFKKKLA
jgi:ABC-type transport system involved in multi-copper enzyme maturation permease subunit